MDDLVQRDRCKIRWHSLRGFGTQESRLNCLRGLRTTPNQINNPKLIRTSFLRAKTIVIWIFSLIIQTDCKLLHYLDGKLWREIIYYYILLLHKTVRDYFIYVIIAYLALIRFLATFYYAFWSEIGFGDLERQLRRKNGTPVIRNKLSNGDVWKDKQARTLFSV